MNILSLDASTFSADGIDVFDKHNRSKQICARNSHWTRSGFILRPIIARHGHLKWFLIQACLCDVCTTVACPELEHGKKYAILMLLTFVCHRGQSDYASTEADTVCYRNIDEDFETII